MSIKEEEVTALLQRQDCPHRHSAGSLRLHRKRQTGAGLGGGATVCKNRQGQRHHQRRQRLGDGNHEKSTLPAGTIPASHHGHSGNDEDRQKPAGFGDLRNMGLFRGHIKDYLVTLVNNKWYYVPGITRTV